MGTDMVAERAALRGSSPAKSASPAILAAAFAVFMFLVFTFRASLNPDEATTTFLSDKRIAATLIGAGVYWLTLRAISQRLDQPIGNLLRTSLRIVVLGSLALLVVRAAFDFVYSIDLEISIARNVRWLLVWLGYFATWVAGFVAHAYYLRLKTVAAPTADAGQAAMPPLTLDSEAAAVLLESIVQRFGEESATERHAIASRLLDKAGYECADSTLMGEDTHQNARAKMLREIAFQLTRDTKSA